MAKFLTRQLPTGTADVLSTGVSLADHIGEENPHSQYLLRSEYNKIQSNITIDESKYVSIDTFKATIKRIDDSFTAHKTEGDPHSQYFLSKNFLDDASIKLNTLSENTQATSAMSIRTALANFMTIADNLTNVPDPLAANKAISSKYAYTLADTVQQHLISTYSQTQSEKIPLHIDNTGNELYARRIHIHTAAELGAAEMDHNHDMIYLKQSDIQSSREQIAYAWSNNGQLIYTNSKTPIAESPVFTDDNLANKSTISVSTANSNVIVVGGVQYIRAAAKDNIILRVPALNDLYAAKHHEHPQYITKYRTTQQITLVPRVDSDKPQTVSNQLWYIAAKDNHVYYRNENQDVHTPLINAFAWLADDSTTTVYTKTLDLNINDSVYTTSDCTTVLTTATEIVHDVILYINGEDADVQNYKLDATTELRIKPDSFLIGREVKLHVIADGFHELVYNKKTLISSREIGTYILNIVNHTGTPEVIVTSALGGSSTGRSMFDIFYSMSTEPPPGAFSLCGDEHGNPIVIEECDKKYPDFWRECIRRHEAKTIRALDFTAWEQERANNNGACGAFGIDKVNHSIILPLIINILQAGEPGVLTPAGLPNIEGKLTSIDTPTEYESSLLQTEWGETFTEAEVYAQRHKNGTPGEGALYLADQATGNDGASTEHPQVGWRTIGINASFSNPIYGKSNTVQPQTVGAKLYIQVYNAVSTTSSMVTDEVDQKIQEIENKVNSIGGGRAMFDIFYSMSTEPPPGAFSLCGTNEGGVIDIENCHTTYPDFWNECIRRKQANTIRTLTIDEWNAEFRNTKQCGAFVVDEVTHTVRLPYIKNILQAVNSLSDNGTLTPAGLPNIEGRLNTHTIVTEPYGAFDAYGDPGTFGEIQNTYPYSFIKFDASKFNPIYGKSNTVEPPTVRARLYIQVYNAAVPQSMASVNAINNRLHNLEKKIDEHSTSRSMFDIFYSMSTEAPLGAYSLCGQRTSDGSLLPVELTSCHTTYPDFWNECIRRASNNSIRTLPVEKWNDEFAAKGSCGAFVIDTVTGTIRLPLITNILQAGEPGVLTPAGLPNIEGRLANILTNAPNRYDNGALSYTRGTQNPSTPTGEGHKQDIRHVMFDASKGQIYYNTDGSTRTGSALIIRISDESTNPTFEVNYYRDVSNDRINQTITYYAWTSDDGDTLFTTSITPVDHAELFIDNNGIIPLPDSDNNNHKRFIYDVKYDKFAIRVLINSTKLDYYYLREYNQDINYLGQQYYAWKSIDPRNNTSVDTLFTLVDQPNFDTPLYFKPSGSDAIVSYTEGVIREGYRPMNACATGNEVVYGKSNTVQPQTVGAKLYIQVYNCVPKPSKLEIVNISNKLNELEHKVNNSNTGRSIFDIFYSLSSQAPVGALPLNEGKEIEHCNLVYPEFWTECLARKAAKTIRVLSEAEYVNEMNTNPDGNCGAFVINENTKYVRLPKITRMIQPGTPGTLIAAGLPNIEGRVSGAAGGLNDVPSDINKDDTGLAFFNASYSAFNVKNSSSRKTPFVVQGVLSQVDESTDWNSDRLHAVSKNHGYNDFDFDASRSNPIYGSSDTVQPPAIGACLYIQVYNAIIPPSTLDMTNFMHNKPDRNEIAELANNRIWISEPQTLNLNLVLNLLHNLQLTEDQIKHVKCDFIGHCIKPDHDYNVGDWLLNLGGYHLRSSNGTVFFWMPPTPTVSANSLSMYIPYIRLWNKNDGQNFNITWANWEFYFRIFY